MFSEKDARIISNLRNNARKKITCISKEIEMPVTTIYDKIRAHEKKFVKRYATLLDFSKLGLHAKANILVNAEKGSRELLQKFLIGHPNVNSLSKVNFGSDFLAEVVFRNAADVENFVEKLEEGYNVHGIQIFNVVEELKKEDFLTKPEHAELI